MINALILCGAVPVYVNPTTHPEIGISLGVPVDKMQKAIEEILMLWRCLLTIPHITESAVI